jgi:hypothetical protein
MDWEHVYPRLQKLTGRQLSSISGKADIKLLEISPDHYIVETSRGIKPRRTDELRKVVSAMSLNKPVHVDSVLLGSGGSRSHPETVIASLPDVEYLFIANKKHIVWIGKDSHELGTLKERALK